MFGELRSYAAAEALAACIASGAVFDAAADMLIEAPDCSMVLLGLLVHLTFSSAAVAMLAGAHTRLYTTSRPSSHEGSAAWSHMALRGRGR